MKYLVILLLIQCFSLVEAHAFCEVRNSFPASTSSVNTEVSSGDSDGDHDKYDCPGSKMELVQTSNTFQIRNLEQSNCDGNGDENGLTLTRSRTAVIQFDDHSAFYYDFKNNKHNLEVQCTSDEMFINLEDRPATWIDPWKPGPQQWRLHLRGNQILVEFAIIYPTNFVKLKTTLQ